jgi:hypothetical protein
MCNSGRMNVRGQERGGEAAAWVAVVQSHVERTRFGAVQVIIHEGRVVRIERTEKIVMESGAADQTTGGRINSQRADQSNGGSRA